MTADEGPPVEAASDHESCRTVCYVPQCLCRVRTIAGCSLPIANEVDLVAVVNSSEVD